MENKLAIIGIFVREAEAVERVNCILHDFGAYVVGRMGLPYRDKKIAVISVIVDAPQDVINNLTGKLGFLQGVSAKTMLPKL
jgi:putative iron-only hydrogenase system regulator